MTATALARALEVSKRTVYRDVDALCEAGIPIHAERGAAGGIVLADGYRRALSAFDDDELQALFASAESPLRDLGVVALPTALLKLAGALPEAQRRSAEAQRERLLVDHNRWRRDPPETALLARLRAALAADRMLAIAYRDREGATTTRTLAPLGLITKAGVWYLVAREDDKGERTFRVDRIVDARETGARFTRPPTFDLDAFWRASVAALERRDDDGFDATLRVRRDALATFAPFWHVERLAEDERWVTVRVRFPTRTIAAANLIIYGDAMELVAPIDLAETVASCATAALARYAASSASPLGGRRTTSTSGTKSNAIADTR